MRVGIPIATNQGLESEVSGHFGKAEYFAIVDIKKPDQKTIVRNELVQSIIEDISILHNLIEHACGSLVDLLMDNRVDVLLVEGIGARPFQLFRQKGVKVYAGAFGTIKEVIRDFLNGMLQELEAASCGHH
ncbi:MAG: NifB/NifX family molybdenum-iron cluster-binding protein [Candidatus Helarchaeota archaeon]